jgi:hypothetical protein
VDLTPDEQGQVDGAMGEHGMCDEKFAAIADVLKQFADDLAELKRVVMDELIGGVTKLYNENQRFEKIGGLKTKYGDLFGENEGAFKNLYDKDLWEALQDYLDEGGFDEEGGDAEVKKLAEQLKAKIEALKGGPAATEVTTVTEEKPAEVEEDPMQPVVDRIKKMKGKGGRVPGIMGEPRELKE